MSRSCAQPRASTLRLRVTRTAESRVRAGHPWIFSESVREANRPGQSGELAVLYDRNDRFLAVGLFDPDSPIAVRILHRGKPRAIDEAWFEHTLGRAMERRQGLFGPDTTGYRLINGESDGWPGLVLDRYGGTCVLKLYIVAWLQRLDLLRSLLAGSSTSPPSGALAEAPHNLRRSSARHGPSRRKLIFQEAEGTDLPTRRQQHVGLASHGERVLPNRLVLRLSRNIQDIAGDQFGLRDGEVLDGPSVEALPVFLENGLRLEADVVHGQKTGFFLDQRENRRRVRDLAGGRRVLNAFSFSGGFSLYAARGGAVSVTDLDISVHALEGAKRNFALNTDQPGVATCKHECVQADVFDWLKRKPTRQFDLIICDPPSLARREAERAGAINAYQRLAADAIRWLAPGGVLFAASCSAHVTADEFFSAVLRAARSSGRRFEEVERTGHAADHPATFPEAEYLKGVYLRLS